MKMRSLLMGLLIAASAQGIAGATQAKELMLVDIKLPIKKAGTTSDVPANTIAEIKVDGTLQKGPYDSVQSKTLDYIIAARGERHKKMIGDPSFSLEMDGGGHGGGDLGEDWKYFAVTGDYLDPRATGIEGRHVSPIDLCNERLNATAGSARAAFLKKGVSFVHQDAYEITGHASADMNTVINRQIEASETIRVPVEITCMPLDRPRPRKDSSTKGPPPRPGKPMAPTISDVSLRVEPAQIVQDGKFLCPSQLKLYGHIEAIRKFYGQALFVGPHYLSNITTLNFQAKGNRNVTGTYTMDWHPKGGLTIAPNAEPAKQKLTFHFNVADKDGKVLDSAEKTVEVSCRKIKVNAPTAGDGMTVNP